MNPLLRHQSYFLIGFNTLETLVVCMEIMRILDLKDLKMENESLYIHTVSKVLFSHSRLQR